MSASKREKELARQRAERQAARRAAAAARTKQRNAVIASVAAALLLAGGVGALATTLGGDPEAGVGDAPSAPPQAAASTEPSVPAARPSASPTAAAAAPAAAGECAYPAAGEPARKVEKPPVEGVETSGVFLATMRTSAGDIAFEMDAAKTPCTSNNLRSLAHFLWFDKTPCHRLTTSGIFVLQCGDPTGTGTGGPGYRFADEALEGATYPRGTVAMANSGPGTNGSQFFLVYKDSPLPPKYTPFGRITEGLDVLDDVAEAGADPSPDGAPEEKVTIQTLRTRRQA